ncbi:MAG TPA: hypothetical protein VFB45_05530 [Pseudolabrys sp.]|nr:hypothetical protein [Pseudolabrys sp.]
MNKAMQDEQAIRSGQITRDQLSPDRQANLDRAEQMAKNFDPAVAQKQLDSLQKVKTDTQDLMAKVDRDNSTCVGGMCVSNFTMARRFGEVTIATRGLDTAADFAKTTKYAPAVAVAEAWQTGRGIGDKAYATVESANKLFGSRGESPPGAASAEGSASAAGTSAAGSAAPPGASGESGAARAGQTAAAKPEAGAALETPINIGKTVSSGGEYSLKTYETAEKMQKAYDGYTNWRDGNPPLPNVEKPPGMAERGVSVVSGATDTLESVQKYQQGKYWESTTSAVKAASDFAKAAPEAFGDKKLLGEKIGPVLGDKLGAVADYSENMQKAFEAKTPEEMRQYQVQAIGSAVKLVDKNAGSGIENIGRTYGAINEYRSISQTENDMMSARNKVYNVIDNKISQRQQFLEFQRQYFPTPQQQQLQQSVIIQQPQIQTQPLLQDPLSQQPINLQ